MRARSWRLRSLAVLATVALVSSGCAWVKRANVDSAGKQANGGTFYFQAISADGRYVAFESDASNLVAGDTNHQSDSFVRDMLTGTTSRVSVGSTGNQATLSSSRSVISGDGRYVAFVTASSNLVPGDTNGTPDVFVRDTLAGTTTRVSVDSAEDQAGADSFNGAPAISGDGRYIAFSSGGTLVAGDTNDTGDIFVRDTVAGTTTRASVTSAGAQANDGSNMPSISADGRYIAFNAWATNLVAGDTNGDQDVFVRDTVAGTTTRVSINSSGIQASSESGWPSISSDGRYVAFPSVASNLVAGDTNDAADVFVRDTVTGTTTRVSLNSSGSQANDISDVAAISGDGRYVTFTSFATNLVAGDTNDAADVFVRDTVTGTTSRVSADFLGNQATIGSSETLFNLYPSISADGRYVVFTSNATNLVGNDTNNTFDVVVRANPQPTVTGITPSTLSRGTTTPVTITGTGFLPGALVVIDAYDHTVTNVTVVSETQITADVTFDADATLNSRNLWVELPGTGPGVGAGAVGLCPSCVTVS